jgi:hypothetical protein
MRTHDKTKQRDCRRTRSRSPRDRNTELTKQEPATEAHVPEIRWISEKELAAASQDLRRLRRIGRQLEQDGDYFGSGNLAYQLRQIAAEIQALVRGAVRVQRRN